MFYVVVNLTAAQPQHNEAILGLRDEPAPRRAARAPQPDQILKLPTKNAVTTIYTSLQDAETAATQAASAAPQTQWAVMILQRVFETTTPKIITKICNEEGELVPEPKVKEVIA